MKKLIENLSINQTECIEKTWKKFKKFAPLITLLPIAKGIILTKEQYPEIKDEIAEKEKLPYRSLIGCLGFLSERACPDISFAVNLLSQFQNNPGKIHWHSLLKVLGYVNATCHLKLNLSDIHNLKLHVYNDAVFASNRDDWVSIGGLTLLIDNVPIQWRTTKQKCVALLSMESKFISLTKASKEVIWIARVFEEYYERQLIPNHLQETIL